MSIKVVKNYFLRVARKSYEMLEPYELKGSRTVLRRESESNLADLVDYSSLVKELGGEVITIAAGSSNHINALDMNEGYGDSGNPVGDKSQFVMSLFEQLDNRDGIKAIDKSIIDRCVALVYQDYYQTGIMPTLVSLKEKLLLQPEIEARSLALKLELFTDGSLDVFSYQTNVNTSSRIVSYDIFKLRKQLKTTGLLVITDAMINRVNDN